MIYLVSPYSHEQESVRHRRFLQARDYTYYALARGVSLFSPIVYGHQFSREYGAGTAHEDWLTFNCDMMDAAECLWVLKLDGWETSRGVQHEIEYAEHNGKPIVYKSMPLTMPLL